MAYNAIGPGLFEKSLKLTPIQYGSLFIFTAIAMVGSSLPNTFLIEKLGFKRIMLLGADTTGVANILLFTYYLQGNFNPFVVVLPVTIFIFGINFVYVNTLPLSTVVYTKKIGNPATLFIFLESTFSALLGIFASYIPFYSQLYLGLILSTSSIVVIIVLLAIFRNNDYKNV